LNQSNAHSPTGAQRPLAYHYSGATPRSGWLGPFINYVTHFVIF